MQATRLAAWILDVALAGEGRGRAGEDIGLDVDRRAETR